MTAPHVLDFSLTQEESAVAASRAAWRASLRGGLLARHLAPLAAFMLVVMFAAVLGWTGLVARRRAELALILAAAGYMAYRLWTRRRFLAERRIANAWAQSMSAAPLRLALDERGFALDGDKIAHRWGFAEGLEIEEISGLVYVWPQRGAPLVWPLRAHVDAADAARFLAEARSRAGNPAAGPGAALDEDD